MRCCHNLSEDCIRTVCSLEFEWGPPGVSGGITLVVGPLGSVRWDTPGKTFGLGCFPVGNNLSQRRTMRCFSDLEMLSCFVLFLGPC